ncbi:NAD(P)/FAD-dependent oxidoreductase [Dyadobacter aurulentus]|uniref:NAD(P)/FAD-dependent oxidoreductase n=1 Tax=Dyadobacter sp. UC 10 TaxID=2605428 RepID=UPI0011F1609E|nr:NAD(P)/FAD-dependent oxidoreductase [Dyadobacter sp. UC 10]KAA0992521.1 NAD(P)/FAD-dependent oxidoreductase [Dyadobacter sp. UC 10]
METRAETFDCGIVGGGLAGLCLAIQLADQGFSVMLFEKNQYPFHKVCGEYISMESYNFLHRLGLPFDSLKIPLINRLGISSEQGYMLEHVLEPGGFGISRHTLDHQLSLIAVQKGVVLQENSKVSDVRRSGGHYQITAASGVFHARIVCGSYGKYAPQFIDLPAKKTGANYIGVKYHVRISQPADRIELHNFRDGYCGISKVDGDKFCLCYLTSSKNLQESGKDINVMEERVLFNNPHLKRIFLGSEFVNKQPLVISNITFEKKATEADGVFLLGDAAGSITPLCGNGMSMGMHASLLLAGEIAKYLHNQQSREALSTHYHRAWEQAFGKRITAGYYLQNLFGKRLTTDLALRFLDKSPLLLNKLVALTHGEKF